MTTLRQIITRADITGILLAGGQGRRMGGQDKGLIPLNGRPVVSYLLEGLCHQVASIVINANRHQEQYQALGVPVIGDQLADYQGPLAGFASAMQHVETDWIFTLPGDSPFTTTNMVERMAAAIAETNADLAVAHDGERLQPVHALIPVRLLPSLQAFLASGDRKIDRWYAQHTMATVDFSDTRHIFRNINTPAQQAQVEQQLLHPPLIGICAYSGTGKTTLLTQLIPLLKDKGLRLAVIKHGHHTLELDKPGKDSFKFREAGADQVILASSARMAIMQECKTQEEPVLADTLKLVNPHCADLILVEGFKHENYPKLEVHRPTLNKPLLYPNDPNIIALISDTPVAAPPGSRDIVQLDLNDPEQITDFILTNSLHAPADTPQRPATPSPAHRIRREASCADATDPDSISLAQAQERLAAAVTPIATYTKLALRDTLGKVLAEAITSPFNVPAHTNSAMDGYALNRADLPTDSVRELAVIGTALAGKAFTGTCQPGQCVRIMTGAMMPAGTDTVIMQEQTEPLDDQRVRIGTGHKAGQNVRHAGEDIQQGQVVLSAGRRLTAADLGLLASLGVAEAKVCRAPRVAFFSTGDELRSIGEPLEPGYIYDSNRYTLYGLLTQLGADMIDMGVIPDQPEQLANAFRDASATADLVITSGGVSVGEADYIKPVLSQLGEIHFWKIAIKPGRPLTFGRLGNALFMGLPGNPVAVMVTFQLFVKPVLLKLAGEQDYTPVLARARCQDKLRKRPGRAEFIRGIARSDAQGNLTVSKAGHQGSGILTSMSQANCFMLLDEACAGVVPGDTVTIQLFDRFLR